jgi:hypothetical protein
MAGIPTQGTATIQIPPDSTGKFVLNVPITVPAGTVLTNLDGSTTTLTVDTIFYCQQVGIVDPSNPLGRVAVVNGAPDTAAYGAVVRLPAGQPDLSDIKTLLSQILAVLTPTL